MAASPVLADPDWVVNLSDTVAGHSYDPIPAGGTVLYGVRVSNNGSSPAPASTISFAIPLNAEMTAASASLVNCVSVPQVGPGTVTCDLPALAVDAEFSGTITVVAGSVGTILVGASVPTAGDPSPTDNAAEERTTVQRGADLGLTITAPATAASGGLVNFGLNVTNYGPNVSDSFVVELPVPTGLTDFVVPSGCALTGATYACTVTGPVAVGASVPLNFEARVSSASSSTVTIVGSVQGTSPRDPVADNNTRTASFATTPGSDLSIAKSRSPAGNPLVGDAVTFTLSSHYTGDSPNNIVITDNIPVGYRIDTVTASTGWTCTTVGRTVRCARTTGAGVPGDHVPLGTITIATTAISPGAVTNEASITSATYDPDLTNNVANDGSTTILEPTIDLRANKTGPSPALMVVGQPYDFHVSTTNLGTTAFTGTVVLRDSLPVGLTYTGTSAPAGWTCSPSAPPDVPGPVDVICQTDTPITLAANGGAGSGTPPIAIHTEANAPGTLSNRVEVSSPDSNLPDAYLPNNVAYYTVGTSTGPNSADVRVTKSVTGSPAFVGEPLTFNIEVINDGPQPSQSVQVLDELLGLIDASGGITGISVTPGLASPFTCSTAPTGGTSARMSCNIATLPVCVAGSDCPRIAVTIIPGGNGETRINAVSAISNATPDPTLSNNSASTPWEVISRVDLTVTKQGAPSPAVAGQDLRWVVTARNLANGMSAAENVTITDILPPDLTFISASPSTGTCTTTPAAGSTTTTGNDRVICNLGTVNNGSQQTVTITVRPNTVTRGHDLLNTVTVASSTDEPNTTNNSAESLIPVENPLLDLMISKTDSVDPLTLDDSTVYTITAINNGPSDAENVVIRDFMPASGISYVSAVASAGGTCTPPASPMGGQFSCSFARLNAGQSVTVQMIALGVVKGVHINRATVESTETLAGFDTNLDNNTDIQSTTLRTRVDLAVTGKLAIPNIVNLNDSFNWQIDVENLPGFRLSEADEVVFTDSLPAGMILTGPPTYTVTGAPLIGATGCSGGAEATAFTCNFGTMPNGTRIRIIAPAKVLSASANPTTIANTAAIRADGSYDGNLTNNQNTGNVTVGTSSLSGSVWRDFNSDALRAATDTGINGITMTLTGTAHDGRPVNRTVATNSSGSYTFANIPQGTYRVTRGAVSEIRLDPGTSLPGPNGGTSGGANVINTVTVPAATTVTDYDFTMIPLPSIGLAKRSANLVVAADGSYQVSFVVKVRNLSLEALNNIQVTDSLAGGSPLFGTHVSPASPATDPMIHGSYTVLSLSGVGACTPNAGFNGAGNTVLASGLTLASMTECELTFRLRVMPTNPLPPVLAGAATRYYNQAEGSGQGVLSGRLPGSANPQLTDLSHNGSNVDPNGNRIANENGENALTPVAPPLDPAIRLQKTAALAGGAANAQVGDLITYSFRVVNTGALRLSNVTLSDPQIQTWTTGAVIPVIEPGQEVTVTGTYALTQTDIDAGSITNQALVTGTDPFDRAVTDTSGTTVNNDDPTITPIPRELSLAVTKSADASLVQTPAALGDQISYSFNIRNTGTVTLYNVTLTDPLPGLNLVLAGPAITQLDPGQEVVARYTATYQATQNDLNAEEVRNQATVTARGPQNQPVSDLSGATYTDNNPTVVPLPVVRSIALIKVLDPASLPAHPVAGNVLTYRFSVKNTGTVRLNSVRISELLIGATVQGTAITLEPGEERADAFTATYPLTQTDIDAGTLSNRARATGQTVPGVTVQDESAADFTSDADTVTPLSREPQIRLLKRVVSTTLTTPPQANQTVTYGFEVINTGNVTLTGITLTDSLAGGTVAGGPITLAPGQSNATAFTYVHTVSQAEINAGRLENTATATGTAPDGGTVSDISGATITDDLPTELPLTRSPAIALVKTITGTTLSTPPVPGDTISYGFEIFNTGNVTLTGLTLTDMLPGIVISGTAPAVLEPGTSTTAFTATYTLTQADINAGQVSNLATASGQPPTGPAVTDDSGSTVTEDGPTVQPLTRTPGIALMKTANTSALSNPPSVGEVVTYSFTVTNTGNVTLTNVVVTDPLTGFDNTATPVASLAPGANTVLTDSYILLQDDLNRGVVENTAVATGTAPDGSGVQDTSGTTITSDDPTVVGLLREPAIRLVKTVDTSLLSSPPRAGEVLNYGFIVTNIGNVTLTNVVVTDPLIGAANINGGPIASLAPYSSSNVITGSYMLTQADINAGEVTNTAQVTGDAPDGTHPTDISGTAVENDLPTVTPITRAPDIALVKTITAANLSSPPVPGDTISYGFEVFNTGNVTLTGLTLTDVLPGIVIAGTPPATLAPGDSTTAFTATYTLTQADINAGQVSNLATVSGQPPTGPAVTDESGSTVTEDAPTVQPVTQSPGIALVKTITAANLSTPPVPGDTIEYGFEVFNTGNVTLTALTLTDVLPGIVISGTAPATLEPGDSTMAFSALYTLTQGDIDAGQVSNLATATGQPPTGPAVTDESGASVTEDAPTVQPLTRTPGIALVKTITAANLSTPPVPGDTISYGFEVFNTGNVTLTGLSLTDMLPGIVISGTPPAELAPGASSTAFSARYTITQADLDAGQVSNLATVTGQPPTGPAVTDISGATVTEDGPTVQPLAGVPQITLLKEADVSGFVGGAYPGDEIPYRFTVTNTGNVTLNGITISDPLPGVVMSGGPITLAPGESDSATFTARYPLSQADIEQAEVSNTATVTGQSVAGPASASSTALAVIGNIEARPETFPPFTSDGGTTSSMLGSDLLNGLPATLATVSIRVITTDAGLTLDPATGLITLAPGMPAGSYQVTYEICSLVVPTLCSQATETVVQLPLAALHAVKTDRLVDNGDGVRGVGDTIEYTITVTNTGNTALEGLSLTDTLTTLSGAALSLTSGPVFERASMGSAQGLLAIGETATYRATYLVTETAVLAGGVSNTVLATATEILPPGVPGTPGTVSDVSDNGIDTDGNTTDDPTITLLPPIVAGQGLSVEKSTTRGEVQRGSSVPWTITVSNRSTAVVVANVVDSLPTGFLYIPGSATLNGVAVPVSVEGRIVTWHDVAVPPGGSVVATLSTRVPTGAQPGEYINRAILRDPVTGTRLAPEATAKVRIMPEPVFDCGDVIGKVFDDVNGDGYQNQGEKGIPAVRLAGVDGTIITTDEHGRFHVPCAMLPLDRGSNFILKLDTRSLPSGYRVTTENPRVVRLTPGKMTELTFGAAISRVVRVDLNTRAFVTGADGKPGLSPQLSAGIDKLVKSLAGEPVTLRIAFHLSKEAGADQVKEARALAKLAERHIRAKWREVARVKLTIEHTIVRE